jgi:hypothetical protein
LLTLQEAPIQKTVDARFKLLHSDIFIAVLNQVLPNDVPSSLAGHHSSEDCLSEWRQNFELFKNLMLCLAE